MDEFDLVVIGGGTGGYTAAIRARQLGLTTALVERDKVGGMVYQISHQFSLVIRAFNPILVQAFEFHVIPQAAIQPAPHVHVL